MITAYEVGAVLRIIDEASPALQKMATAAREFNTLIAQSVDSLKAFSNIQFTGLLTRLGNVDKGLKGIADTSGTSTKVIADNFVKVDGALGASLETARLLKVQLGEIATASKTISAPTLARVAAAGGGGGALPPSIRRGTQHGGPGAPHMHLGREGIGGGWSLPSTPIMAVGAALGYGAWLDAEMEDAIFQIEYHTGEKGTPETNAKYRKIVQDAMSKTGSSLADVVAATKQEVRMFKGTPGGGVDVLPEMLTAAATEAKVKGSSLEEAMRSFIGLAHMTKEYTPEQIKKLAPAFAFLSASNPASLGGIERAAGYAVPILQSGLEIDPIQTLLLGTALTRAGATNTKSGTWLRNMALAAMPGTSLMSKIAFQKHEEALKALGLVDESNKPTWFTEGKPDLIKMLDIAGSHAANIPLEKRAAYEKQLFGTQGFGGFALLADPAVKQQIAALQTEMNSPAFRNRYANFMQDYGATSPLQMGRQLWADTQNALMDLGKTVMPAVIQTIKDLDKGIKDSEAQWAAFTIAIQPAIDALNGLSGAIHGVITSLGSQVSGLPEGIPGIPWKALENIREGLFGIKKDSPFPASPLAAPPGGAPPLPAGGQVILPTGHAATALFGGMKPAYTQQSLDSEMARESSRGRAMSTPLHIHNKMAIYLDGRVLAEAMSTELANLSLFPTQAPQGDTGASWEAPHYNFNTG